MLLGMTTTNALAATDSGCEHDYADLGALMSLMTGDEKHSAAATSTLTLWVLRQVLGSPRHRRDPA
jgi:transketolase